MTRGYSGQSSGMVPHVVAHAAGQQQVRLESEPLPESTLKGTNTETPRRLLAIASLSPPALTSPKNPC